MKTRILAPLGAMFALALMLVATVPAFAGEKNRVVFHLDEADKGRMNLVLNNAANVSNYFADKGEEVEIEIVAYGPGLKMLVDNPKANPVHKRMSSYSDSFPNIGFRACGNTMKKMTKKAKGKAPKLISEAQVVPAGVIHLMERQNQGWNYIRP